MPSANLYTFRKVQFRLYSFDKLLRAMRQAGRQADALIGENCNTVRRTTFPIRTTSKVIFLLSVWLLLSCYHIDGSYQLLRYKSKGWRNEKQTIFKKLCRQALEGRVMTFGQRWRTYEIRYSRSFYELESVCRP
jgi:hypothetical protein